MLFSTHDVFCIDLKQKAPQIHFAHKLFGIFLLFENLQVPIKNKHALPTIENTNNSITRILCQSDSIAFVHKFGNNLIGLWFRVSARNFATRRESRSLMITGPRRRRLEAFTTDGKIILLTRRRVGFSRPRQRGMQYFGGDYMRCGRFQKFPGVIPPDIRPCKLFGKERKSNLGDEILHMPLTISLLCLT